ncbi:MAG: methyltransferase [Alphaproteobacteria bacterium]|nr:methyltransferase [Alphaproteobacteria bacterium]
MIRGSSDAADFVLRQTALGHPALVPEIALRLASDALPLWHATEEVLSAEGLPPPYWAFAWPGGQALARHILDHPETVAGKRVLDVGAGSGIAAIAAAKAGAARTTAIEIDPFAIAALRINSGENAVAIEILEVDPIGRSDLAADIVLIGDLCYERPMADRLVPWLKQLAGAGTLVLLGDPGRAYLPKAGLVEVARHLVPTSRELEDREIRETVIWRLAG